MASSTAASAVRSKRRRPDGLTTRAARMRPSSSSVTSTSTVQRGRRRPPARLHRQRLLRGRVADVEAGRRAEHDVVRRVDAARDARRSCGGPSSQARRIWCASALPTLSCLTTSSGRVELLRRACARARASAARCGPSRRARGRRRRRATRGCARPAARARRRQAAAGRRRDAGDRRDPTAPSRARPRGRSRHARTDRWSATASVQVVRGTSVGVRSLGLLRRPRASPNELSPPAEESARAPASRAPASSNVVISIVRDDRAPPAAARAAPAAATPPRRATPATRRPMPSPSPRTPLGLDRHGRGCSGPHRPQARPHVDGRAASRIRPILGRRRPVAHAREPLEDAVGDEARARRVDVPVAVAPLLPDEEAQRVDQRAADRAPASSPRRAAAAPPRSARDAGRQVGRDAAVGGVEHEDAVPLLPLGGVDRRQDQVVLVEQRRPRLGRPSPAADRASARTGSARATDSAPRAARAARDPARARCGVVVEALEVRLVPAAHQAELRRHAAAAAQPPEQLAQRRPVARAPPPAACAARTPAIDARPLGERVAPRAAALAAARRRAGAAARGTPATRSRGFSAQRRHAQRVLDVRRLEKLEPAVLDERDVAPRRARPRARRCGARRGTAPPAACSGTPASRALEDAS